LPHQKELLQLARASVVFHKEAQLAVAVTTIQGQPDFQKFESKIVALEELGRLLVVIG
jgi:hypothetical protein